MKTDSHINSSELKSRSAHRLEGGKDQLPSIDFKKRLANRGLPTDQVLDLIHNEAPNLWQLCQVVGKWVWVQFREKQPPTVTAELSQLGFHWNKRRQLWQHPCGHESTSTTQDPREKYSTFYPAD